MVGGSTGKRSHPKFKLFYLLSRTHEIVEVSKHKGKIKFDQNLGVPKWGDPFKRGHQNSSFFDHSRSTDEYFRIDKYKLKTKYDKIWGSQNKGVSLKWDRQNLNFLATHARHMKFSG